MKKITRYFFEGLLIIVPLTVTLYVVYAVFINIDSIFKLKIPGAGFLLTIVTIIITGFISSNILTSKIVQVMERAFTRLPFVNMIYTAIKDLTNAFVGDRKIFNKPVLVAVSQDKAVNVIGFMTRDGLETMGHSDKVAVYLPHSYNFSGNLIIVARERVTPISSDSGDVMAFIVSGGVAAK